MLANQKIHWEWNRPGRQVVMLTRQIRKPAVLLLPLQKGVIVHPEKHLGNGQEERQENHLGQLQQKVGNFSPVRFRLGSI